MPAVILKESIKNSDTPLPRHYLPSSCFCGMVFSDVDSEIFEWKWLSTQSFQIVFIHNFIRGLNTNTHVADHIAEKIFQQYFALLCPWLWSLTLLINIHWDRKLKVVSRRSNSSRCDDVVKKQSLVFHSPQYVKRFPHVQKCESNWMSNYSFSKFRLSV